MKQPWFKFYPADWRADPALRMCSLAARGLWMEMLCIMHEATPRGSLLVGITAPTLKQLSGITGSTLRETERLLGELESAKVFSRDGEIIYSRRMKREVEKAETDKANGKRGGNPHLKGGVNPRDKAQKLEARSQKLEAEKKDLSIASQSQVQADGSHPAVEAKFLEFWREYPKRGGPNPRKPVLAKFIRALAKGADAQAIIEGAKRYRADCEARGIINTPLVAQALTWINQARWQDDAPLPLDGDRPGRPDGMPRDVWNKFGQHWTPETPWHRLRPDEWEAWKRERANGQG